jgi:uncharacterized surface protein with fasciclin (FAS1) repeats
MVHGIDNILAPPTTARRFVSLFPSKFSTLELAAEKTGLLPHKKHDDKHEHDEHHHGSLTGLTFFAPTNAAFAKLGPAANAFLFNTEKGLGYLRALIKYHLVVNQTLYSDAYYGVPGDYEDLLNADHEKNNKDDGEEREKSDKGKNGHFHIDLPTLLGDRSLSIDIARWYGFIRMRVNAYHTVAVQDCLASDGVLQVMSNVLIPPRQPKQGAATTTEWIEAEGEITVDELVQRLQPYVDAEQEGEEKEKGQGNVESEGSAAKEVVWGEL